MGQIKRSERSECSVITGGVQGPALGPLVGVQGAKPPEALSITANLGHHFHVFGAHFYDFFIHKLFVLLSSLKLGAGEKTIFYAKTRGKF